MCVGRRRRHLEYVHFLWAFSHIDMLFIILRLQYIYILVNKLFLRHQISMVVLEIPQELCPCVKTIHWNVYVYQPLCFM